MKTLLIGVNAKYIHPNLAIRLLKANTKYQCDIIEYTIKDSIDNIYNYIIDNKYEFVGFSVYIWNVNLINELLYKLKDTNIKILLGGPEVSYNTKYYFDNELCDYIIKNEGEEAFDKLLAYLHNDFNLLDIPNLYYKDGYTFDKLVDINSIIPAYDLLDNVDNKIIYLETSRGCPYHCSYCMASLDNKVRFFDINMIKEEILKLNKRGAKVIKLLDRTFNANKKKFIELIDFIIANRVLGQSYQFEITGDLLSLDLIDYINERAPKHLFRFEIGIQSTNIKANLSVRRIQNNEKLFTNIRRIQDADIIDLHLDLIAGLPYEDYDSFKNTFNEVVSLKPKELQLGFLKLLHGTQLKIEAECYNYKYMDKAPYEIISNDFMSENDIHNIHIAEDAFETYYNSMVLPLTNKYLIDNYPSMYDIYYNVGLLDFKRKPLEDRYKIFNDYFINYKDYNKIHELIIIDYLNYYNVKPKAWWMEKLSKEDKNNTLRLIVDNNMLNYTLDTLYRNSLVIPLEDKYIVVIYKDNKKEINFVNKINLC